jgi:hypothetical protein
MKIKSIGGRIERKIVIGMIVSSSFLRNIIDIYQPDFFTGDYAKTVSKWCVEYYRKYKKAPGTNIEQVYLNQISKGLNEELSILISKFLSSISTEYEQTESFDSDFLLDEAISYFKKQKMKILSTDISIFMEKNQPDKAEELIKEFTLPRKRQENGISIIQNPNIEKIIEAFEEDTEPLFYYPGALGRLINNQLTRDSFVLLMGPEKRGKTFWLNDMAYMAARYRRNVAIFQAGDMSEKQETRRLDVRISGKPYLKKFTGEYLHLVLDCKWNQDNSCRKKNRTCRMGISEELEDITLEVIQDYEEYKPCTYCMRRFPAAYSGSYWFEKRKLEQLGWEEAYKKRNEFKKRMKGKDIRLATYPNNTLTVSEIKNVLNKWEEEGFKAEVVIVDYMGILVPSFKTSSTRDNQNEIYKEMRALSQEKHCLVISADQSDAASYDKHSLSMNNFSEDKRKYGHVTCTIALNQTKEEKQKGLMRLGLIVVREDEFSIDREVTVLQSLRIARPHLASFPTERNYTYHGKEKNG